MHLEDWLHFLALAFFSGQVAADIIAVVLGGSGHHISELQPFHIIRLSKVLRFISRFGIHGFTNACRQYLLYRCYTALP